MTNMVPWFYTDRGKEIRHPTHIVFDNLPHYGTVQTDTDTRVVISFNLRLA